MLLTAVSALLSSFNHPDPLHIVHDDGMLRYKLRALRGLSAMGRL